MEKLAEKFIEEVKSKGHVKKLINNASFSLCIQTEREVVILVFRNENIFITYPQNNENPDVTIFGSIENLRSIFMGKEKLREAINKRKIQVQSSFRRLLFLESLFILSKNYDI